jgi:RsiW-degrading membrane proteinase PrsW (M82 family)
MTLLNTDPKILTLSFLAGILPSLVWLWFWLREDDKNPEPKGALTIVFIMGMLSVMIVLPIQTFIKTNIASSQLEIILWASAEEIIKYLAVLIVLYKTSVAEEPVDWPIYMVTAALGFAALENMLFLVKPFSIDQALVALLTGQLRFLGSTLLHTISSGIIGLSIGMSLYMNKSSKKIFLIFGFLVSIALHSVFNFFIINGDGVSYLKILAFLWITTIVVMLLFEKVRRMSEKIINQ